jgi:septum formation protein
MLILASQSPRRRELLGLITEEFLVRPTGCDESFCCPDPAEHARQLALRKCAAAVETAAADDCVIAADTVVFLDGVLLEKPATPEEAKAMLSRLSGHTHTVCTGVTVRQGDKILTESESTEVYFRPATEAELLAYIATGEPMDKAGSYGIQGGAALFCEGLQGDYYNVMGLPVCRLFEILREIAPEWMGEML